MTSWYLHKVHFQTDLLVKIFRQYPAGWLVKVIITVANKLHWFPAQSCAENLWFYKLFSPFLFESWSQKRMIGKHLNSARLLFSLPCFQKHARDFWSSISFWFSYCLLSKKIRKAQFANMKCSEPYFESKRKIHKSRAPCCRSKFILPISNIKTFL